MRKVRSSSPTEIAKAINTSKKDNKKSKTQSTLATQFSGGLINKVGKVQITPRMLRNLSKANPFVAIAISKLKQRVAKTPWIFKAKDEKKQKQLQKKIDALTALFKKPNNQNDTFRTLLVKTVDDILVFDQGVWEKVKNMKGEIVYLFHVPGYTIYANRDDFGDFKEAAYLQYVDSANSIPITEKNANAEFAQDDLMIFQANPSSEMDEIDRGISPVEQIISTIVAGIQALLYNTSTFSESALPPAIINLKGVPTAELTAFKQAFEAQLKGNPHANAYTNAEVMDAKLLRPSNQEMQFYELNLWLARVVISAFDLSPQDFGLTMDVNKSTSESQDKLSKEGGIATYLDVISEEINGDFMEDMALTDPDFAEIEFTWHIEDKVDPLKQAQIDNIRVSTGIDDVNELRIRDGKEAKPEYEPDPFARREKDDLDEEDEEDKPSDLKKSAQFKKWKNFYK